MNNFLDSILSWIKSQFSPTSLEPIIWQKEWTQFLQQKVNFYRALSKEDKRLFEQRVILFWQTTRIESGQFEVNDEDRLLVAASAIIPVWAFPKWHYFNLEAVYLLPAPFNDQFEMGKPDSLMTGMVGYGPMAGKLVLCRTALHYGFENTKDKYNVGLHEFVHLIDMADGECDGYPERLKEFAFSIPWFELVGNRINEIENRKGNIPDYGATNRAEFFAVASEYFFERPKLMHRKYPELYKALSDIYQSDVLAISKEIKPRKKAPCPCGSGKRYKRCCMPQQ